MGNYRKTIETIKCVPWLIVNFTVLWVFENITCSINVAN